MASSETNKAFDLSQSQSTVQLMTLRKKRNKGRWLKFEDELLIKWVSLNGPTAWHKCSETVGTRTSKQCRDRWVHSKDPKILKIKWTDIEDYVIFKIYNKMGSKWTYISKLLPGRSENNVKNRFYSIIRKFVQKTQTNGSEVRSSIMNQDAIHSAFISKTSQIDKIITQLNIKIDYSSNLVSQLNSVLDTPAHTSSQVIMDTINLNLKNNACSLIEEEIKTERVKSESVLQREREEPV